MKAAVGGTAEVQSHWQRPRRAHCRRISTPRTRRPPRKDFDKAYREDVVSDHEKDVKEFEKASKGAKDADIKAWASKTLPTLQEHLVTPGVILSRADGEGSHAAPAEITSLRSG
jgi:putative membrane protein